MFVLFCDYLLLISGFLAQVTIFYFQCDMIFSFMKTYLSINIWVVFTLANVFVHVHNFFGK